MNAFYPDRLSVCVQDFYVIDVQTESTLIATSLQNMFVHLRSTRRALNTVLSSTVGGIKKKKTAVSCHKHNVKIPNN